MHVKLAGGLVGPQDEDAFRDILKRLQSQVLFGQSYPDEAEEERQAGKVGQHSPGKLGPLAR